MVDARRLWAKQPGAASKLFAFERNGRVGFIDSKGRVVIPAKIEARIEEVGDFSEGLAAVSGLGYVDETGKWVIRRKLWTAGRFVGGFAWVAEHGEGGASEPRPVLVDRSGRVVATWERMGVGDFSEGLAAFEAQGKPGIRKLSPPPMVYRDYPGLRGFLNAAGEVAIRPVFAGVGPFREGLAVAVEDGYCHIARPDGQRDGSPTSGYPSSCGGAPEDAVAPCRTGYIGRTGRYVIEPRYESAQDFQEGLGAVREGGRWGFVGPDGAMVIPPQFARVKPFREGLAAVLVGEKWGYVDRGGRMVIAPQFAEAEPFSDGRAMVNAGRGAYYIDREGRTAIAGPFREATPFVNGLAAVLVSETKVAYIDRTGKRVFAYERR